MIIVLTVLVVLDLARLPLILCLGWSLALQATLILIILASLIPRPHGTLVNGDPLPNPQNHAGHR